MSIGDSSLHPVCVLGGGRFGHVYLCKSILNGVLEYVCVKRIRVRQPKLEIKMMDEIYIISQLKHPNIVRFIRAFVFESSINIVMEYASNGTVRDAINNNINLRPSISKRFFNSLVFGIILGLEYLHIRHIIHRDLKPENILLDGENKIKIADFGISTIHSSNKPTHSPIGTYLYMAPEVMLGEKHGFKSDIWSLGCILYEMCNGESPFKNAKNVFDLKYLIQNSAKHGINTCSISTYYGDEWACLCEKMMNVNPNKRISIFSIVTHDPKVAISFYNNYFKYSNFTI
ncbi:serine/threonine-protein kinase Nek7 isoform X1 [Anastrepha ludens]|uniref:serine/threonine-protein kinase Nek7 isoform X1 n=1 Tax=Anastrepha ludens TaxID=28586 RepID=UPI0023AEE476|nr:serine/threonine-protein kinase Nek7 isoform X1 [Anastrepha ludens]